MLVFCMKRILIILISILLILSSCFSANCVTRTTYKFLNNSKLYYFADSKNNYIVSVKGKTITANELYSELKKQNGEKIAINIIDEYILNKKYKTTDDMKNSAK